MPDKKKETEKELAKKAEDKKKADEKKAAEESKKAEEEAKKAEAEAEQAAAAKEAEDKTAKEDAKETEANTTEDGANTDGEDTDKPDETVPPKDIENDENPDTAEVASTETDNVDDKAAESKPNEFVKGGEVLKVKKLTPLFNSSVAQTPVKLIRDNKPIYAWGKQANGRQCITYDKHGAGIVRKAAGWINL